MIVAVGMMTLPPVLLIAALFAYAVQTRPGIWFGVSVPVEFPSSPEARRLQTAHRLRCAALLLLTLGVLALGLRSSRVALVPTAILVELVGNLSLWSFAIRAARPYAIQAPLVRSASLGTEADPSSRWGTLLLVTALLPPVLSALYLQRHYAEIPLRFPRHWDRLATPDGWSTRTPLQVFGPLLVGAGLLVFLYILQSSRTFRVGRLQRISQPLLGAVAWLLSAIFCFRALAPLLVTPAHTVAGLLAIAETGTVLITVALVWAWSRTAKATEPPYDGTPDAAWRAGIFYYNPNDAALFVAKRLGYGWTLNFAHRRAWMWMLVVLVPLIGGLYFKYVH